MDWEEGDPPEADTPTAAVTSSRLGGKCLICTGPCSSGRMELGRGGGGSDLKLNKKEVNYPVSLIDQQLSVIFTLRELLELPAEMLEGFLKTLGDPSCWRVGVCGKCNGHVKKGLKLYLTLVKVERKLSVVKGLIVKQIKDNSKAEDIVSEDRRGNRSTRSTKKRRRIDEDQVGEEQISVTEESRSFVRNRDYTTAATFRNPFISGDAQARKLAGGALTLSSPPPPQPAPANTSSPTLPSHSQPDCDFIPLEIDLLHIPPIKVEVSNDDDDAYEPAMDDLLHSKYSSDSDQEDEVILPRPSRSRNRKSKSDSVGGSRSDHDKVDERDGDDFGSDHKLSAKEKVKEPSTSSSKISEDEDKAGDDNDNDDDSFDGAGVEDDSGGDDDEDGSSSSDESEFDERKVKRGEGSYFERFKGSKFRCIRCRIICKTRDELVLHVKLHKTSPHHCKTCERVYPNEPHLRRHIQKYHPDIKMIDRRKLTYEDKNIPRKPRKKYYKPKTFDDWPDSDGEGEIREGVHYGLTPSNNYKCLRCPHSRIPTLAMFIKHYELHRKSQHNCKICKRAFVGEVRLRNHWLKKHPDAGPPQFPDPAPTEDDQDPDHEAKKGSPTIHTCYICRKNFAREGGLRDHIERFHRRLFRQMKRLKPTAPSTVRLDPSEFRKQEVAKDKYECPLCDKYSFLPDFSEELCDHLEDCHGNDVTEKISLSCPICKDFSCSEQNKVVFGEHLLSCHEKGNDTGQGSPSPLSKRLFECVLCPASLKKYFQLEDFIEHYQDHVVRPWRCTLCPKRFNNNTYVNWHWRHSHTKECKAIPSKERGTMQVALPELCWWCRLCNEKFSLEGDRDAHLRACHPEDSGERSHFCTICLKGYASQEELDFHTGIVHMRENFRLESVFPCDLCDKFCVGEKCLNMHQRKRHRINLFVCELCGVECVTETNFRNHKQLHLGVKAFACDQCPQSFTTAAYLRTHKFKLHTAKDKEINPLVCKYCDKLFSTLPNRLSHEASVHTHNFKHVCHLCGYGTMSQAAMNQHQANVHGQGVAKTKTYICPVEECGKVYSSLGNFKAHKNMHEGEPRFPCQYCGKGFYTNVRKRLHETIHENAESRPFKCDTCGKGFPRQDYLYIHKRSHNKSN